MKNTSYRMFRVKKILSGQQLETYLLIILPISWLLVSVFFEKSILLTLLEGKKELVLWSFFYGGCLIKIGFLLFYLFVYFKIMLWLGQWIGRRIFKDGTTAAVDAKQFLLSFAYLMLAVGLYNLVLAVSLVRISNASSYASIITYSQLFMSVDQYIFGIHPQILIQQLSASRILDYLLIQSYCKLPLFFTIVLIGLLSFKKEYFRKFVIAIFMAPFIAMPFWYTMPAVSPEQMYRQNIFSLQSVLSTQQQYKEVVTSKNLNAFLQHLKVSFEKPNNDHPLVSTNPSMHVAWGTIITCFAIILWWPLAFIFVPWLILNMLSTLYTMQHYAIDLPAGLVCAGIAIMITHYLFKFEKKYYTGKYTPLYFITIIQADVHFLKTSLMAKFLRCDKQIEDKR